MEMCEVLHSQTGEPVYAVPQVPPGAICPLQTLRNASGLDSSSSSFSLAENPQWENLGDKDLTIRWRKRLKHHVLRGGPVGAHTLECCM